MNKMLLSMLSAGALVLSTTALAESFEYPEPPEDGVSGFTITPMINNFSYDDDRGLKDETAFGLGIGYRFSHPYEVEFVYINGDADAKAGGSLGDLEHYRLEMLYDIGESERWRPYLSLGAASTEFGTTTTADNEGALSLGAGTLLKMTDHVGLRMDARYMKGVGDIKGSDVVLGLGLRIFTGSKSEKVVTPVEPPVYEEPAGPSLAERCAVAGGVIDGADCVRKSVSQEEVNLNVQFEYDSFKVQSGYVGEIEQLANFMNEYPSATVVIEGHTDSIGSDAYNQRLSQQRVTEVARILSDEFNIAANRVSAVGYGETQPIAPNDTAENRAQNRRVVASITVELEEIVTLDLE